MFLRRAMRYYRLWIYTCNAVLLVCVLVFLAVSLGILSNQNLSLVPTPAPYHPTLLYGYLALILQAGVLQAIGCIGAMKLCQKLLNTYWFLLLSLLLGDLLVGFTWLIRFSHLTEGLKPYLRNTLQTQYGKEREITETWDSLQVSVLCCGAESPMDYYNISFSVLPDSCCHISTFPTVTHETDHVVRYVSTNSLKVLEGRPSLKSEQKRKNIIRSLPPSVLNLSCRESDKVPNLKGCADHIIKWYKDSAETLMIFGFCVITFLKLCFVGILRFEIQEMIQKIKIIQGDVTLPPNPELAAALGMIAEKTVEGGGLLVTGIENTVEAKDMTQVLPRHNHISTQLDAIDSDTNSNCALITDTPERNPQHTKRKPNGNNNELTELREFTVIRQTQI